MKVGIWDFVNSDIKICVDLKKDLKGKIAFKIFKDISNIAKRLEINPARLYEYFVWQKSVIPLKVIYSIANILNLPLGKLEKNITLIKQQHVPRKNSIKNPKLPLKISPYFTSIVANLFFDGSVPKDGKGTYYNQKDIELMNDFLKRVNFVLGNVNYSIKKDHRGILKCRLPRLIGEICRHVYKIDSFGTFDAKIPMFLFKLNDDHKKAFILAAIIDEGSIAYDGSIIFGVSNKRMIEDFNDLCKNVGLETGGIKQKHNLKSNWASHYYLYITSISKFKDILDEMKSKYPLLSLRYKENRLIKALKIKDQSFSYTKEFSNKRKGLVIGALNKKSCTINQLAENLIMPPRTLRRYMYRLMKEGKISRTKVGSEYYYSSNTQIG